MTYTIAIFIALLAIVLFLSLLLFMQRHAVKSKDIGISAPADRATADQASSTEKRSPQWGVDSSSSGSFPDRGTPRTSGSTRVAQPIYRASSLHNNVQGHSDLTASPRSQQELGPFGSLRSLPPPMPPKPAHARGRYELEQEYERGMLTLYDEKIGAINFIGLHVVMNTPAEVELAFYVCKRQIRTVLRSKGLEHAPTLTDIGGIVIGKDATEAWGLALKNYLEEMCIKVGKDTYLLAHYNSQADRPNQNALQEKIRRIQFMTSAAINNFQSNIFDTREEAAAFLQRMREIYRV